MPLSLQEEEFLSLSLYKVVGNKNSYIFSLKKKKVAKRFPPRHSKIDRVTKKFGAFCDFCEFHHFDFNSIPDKSRKCLFYTTESVDSRNFYVNGFTNLSNI